jgi:hypothetical protein
MKIMTKQEELTDKYGTKPSDLPQLHIIGYERTQEYKKLFHMNEKPVEVIKKSYAKFTEMGGVLVDFDNGELVDAKGQKLFEDYDDDLKGVNFNEAYSDIIFNNTLPSPIIFGIANPDIHGNKTIIEPEITPLSAKGTTTFQNFLKSVTPKSKAAS